MLELLAPPHCPESETRLSQEGCGRCAGTGIPGTGSQRGDPERRGVGLGLKDGWDLGGCIREKICGVTERLEQRYREHRLVLIAIIIIP